MKEKIIVSEKPLSFEEARSAIKKELLLMAAKNVAPASVLSITQIKAPVVPMDNKAWLAQQRNIPKIYWRRRDEDWSVAGVGAAFSLSLTSRLDGSSFWEKIEQLTKKAPDLRVHVGISFPDQVSSKEWHGFHALQAIIPRFEIVSKGDRSSLLCNLITQEGGLLDVDKIIREIDSLRMIETISPITLESVAQHNIPSFEDWGLVVQQALQAIADKDMEKVVIARRLSLDFAEPVDPLWMLTKALHSFPEGYAFLFQFEQGRGFIGITPELLFSRTGRDVRAEAIAGTRPRSTDPAQDEALRQELLSSEKDKREHHFVVDALTNAFRHLCRSFAVESKGRVLALKNQQHFLIRLIGRLDDNIQDKDLCEALHPTPAVGGVPAQKAKEFIHHHEGFDRGWFGGAVGVFSQNHTEVAVAIRSCLVDKTMLHVYGGAGIVQGSTLRQEWDEIEAKMKNYIDIVYAN